MSALEKLILWLSFILVLIVGAIVLFGDGGGDGGLENRVAAVETHVQTYEKWADSIGVWADTMNAWALFINENLESTPPGDTIICPSCVTGEDQDPPGGGPCKPGQC